MFVTLLVVTFFVALLVSFVVVRIFEKPIDSVLGRIIAEDISVAWERYLKFAIYIVGVSGGVRVWQLERYIMPGAEDVEPVVLNGARWTLEVYRTIISTTTKRCVDAAGVFPGGVDRVCSGARSGVEAW